MQRCSGGQHVVTSDDRTPTRRAAPLAVPSAPMMVGMAVALILGASGTAGAQPVDPDAPPYFYERFAFEVADTDGDGLVSEAEFARDAAAAFSGLDQDRSGTLTPDELGPHDPAAFARIDANGDGALTFSEVMRYKMRAFEAADQNGDDALSFEEMLESALAEQGIAR